MERINFLDEIKPEDLPKQYKRYAEVIGLENLVKLATKYGGTQIYIPKQESLPELLGTKK